MQSNQKCTLVVETLKVGTWKTLKVIVAILNSMKLVKQR